MRYFILLSALVALGACNTVEGAGEDISAGGAAISDVAEDTEKAIKQSTY